MFADGVEFDPNLALVGDGDCNCTVKFCFIDGIQKGGENAEDGLGLSGWAGPRDRQGRVGGDHRFTPDCLTPRPFDALAAVTVAPRPTEGGTPVEGGKEPWMAGCVIQSHLSGKQNSAICSIFSVVDIGI